MRRVAATVVVHLWLIVSSAGSGALRGARFPHSCVPLLTARHRDAEGIIFYRCGFFFFFFLFLDA